GRLTLEGSTVSGNQADVDEGVGGGIYVSEGGSLTATNCTVSGNSARSDGGGIYFTKGPLTIRSSTVAFNTADAGNAGGGQGGGLFVNVGADATLLSTIVADNAVGATGLHPDVSGNVTAAFSLVENVAGATFTPGSANNILGADPRLGPLQFNGGPTQT